MAWATLFTMILLLLLSLVSQNARAGITAKTDPLLVQAEKSPKIIKVRKDGSGDFTTVTDAVNSIPSGNTVRTIVHIGSGVYVEKILVDHTKPFVTFYGLPHHMPTLVYSGTAQQFGTINSASTIVESDYFMAVNIIFMNSSPEPTGKQGELGQAAAMRISGDKANFYNCRFIGFQNTLCDDKGRHFFSDCHIEGTVDFIFGNGKSLYEHSEIRSVANGLAVITANARQYREDTGFSFVDCNITGTGNLYLGRSLRPGSRVVFARTYMGANINPLGWKNDHATSLNSTVYYGEFECTGPGANTDKRPPYVKVLTLEEVKPYLDSKFIRGSQWIINPPKLPKL